MANPKASATTQSYRQTIKSKDESGNVFTTTNYLSERTPPASQSRSPSRGGSSAGGVGNPVELFVVGSLFIWFVVSGKFKAIIEAAKA